MQPRREPLLWLQCLAIGAIPLELLLIRVLLAGADPGPVPLLERLLLWAVAVLAPAVALWRRPADWGSLLLLRSPVASRSTEQLHFSAMQGGMGSQVGLAVLTVVLLPLLWWLDESAGLLQEFSPLQEQSRLVSLLLSAPVLALVVWQAQQLLQALLLLSHGESNETPAESWDSQRVNSERSSIGFELLQLQPLAWPEVEAMPVRESSSDQANEVEQPDTKPVEVETKTEESTSSDLIQEEPDSALLETAAVAIEPEQGGEEQESASLDSEVVDGDTVASGEAEQHGEQPEAGGGEEGEPDQAP